MPTNFRDRKEFIQYLVRYASSDITLALIDSNAKDFCTIENLAAILTTIPTQSMISKFIGEFYQNLPLENVLNLIENNLTRLHPSKTWYFFIACFPKPLQGISASNLQKMNTLFHSIPHYNKFLSESKNFSSFSINTADDVEIILSLLVNKLNHHDLEDVIIKCKRANPQATNDFLSSPVAVYKILANITRPKIRGLLPYIWGRLENKAPLIEKALSQPEQFDNFIQLLKLADNRLQETILTSLFTLPVEQISQPQLAALKPYINLKSQYMKTISIRLYQQNLLSTQELFDHLSTLKAREFNPYFRQLSDAQQQELFQYAESYFHGIQPSYELMKQYQDYEKNCFFLVSCAQLSLSLMDENANLCAGFALVLTVPVDIILVVLGAIPALIGLSLMCKRSSLEQAFREKTGADDSVELSTVSSQYLKSHGLWSNKAPQSAPKQLEDGESQQLPLIVK